MSAAGRLPRVKQALGIDRAIAYTLLGRGWSVVAGPITLLLVATSLTKGEQGYYYTFSSVLGLQVFFELGLGIVILQFASHEKGRLEWADDGTLRGDPEAKARLAALLAKSVKWYGAVALLMVLTLIPGGVRFFGSDPSSGSVRWLLPWVLVVCVEAGVVLMSPVLAVLEGCGLVSEVARRRALQGVLGSVATWTLLLSNGRLLTAPVLSAVGLVWWSTWLLFRKRRFLTDLLSAPRAADALRWRQEVWPFQWRIALSVGSGYFIFLVFNPVLFRYHGPETAGQMGMSLTAMGALATVAAAWIGTKMSPFGALIARREFDELDRLFFPALWRSLALMVFLGVCFWGAATVFFLSGHRLGERVLPPLPLAFFVGTTILNHVLGAEAVYLRAHKEEPFLWLSVAVAAGVISSTYLLGRTSVVGMMAGNFVVTLLGLIAGTAIFLRKREAWHR
jgi:hypothetical protein